MTVFPVILMDVFSHLTPTDQKYFRESREKMFGSKLEDVSDVMHALYLPCQYWISTVSIYIFCQALHDFVKVAKTCVYDVCCVCCTVFSVALLHVT